MAQQNNKPGTAGQNDNGAGTGVTPATKPTTKTASKFKNISGKSGYTTNKGQRLVNPLTGDLFIGTETKHVEPDNWLDVQVGAGILVQVKD
jgi:hypothetical protein